MTDPAPGPGPGDLFSLLAAVNPLASLGRSIAQFHQTVDNVNLTMAQLAELAARVNRFLDDIEPAVKAIVPPLTRTITMLDAMNEAWSASPAVRNMPANLAASVEQLSELGKRLQPLTQMAEAAGGMFGPRGLANLFGGFAPGNAGGADPSASGAAGGSATVGSSAARSRAAKQAGPQAGQQSGGSRSTRSAGDR